MPPKKKGKGKKSKKKSVKKRDQKGSEGESSSLSLSAPMPTMPKVPSVNTAILNSLQALPITILKNATKTYILLMNKAVEKYLAMAGVTPDIDGKALDKQIVKSSELFSKGVRIVGKSSKEIIKDCAVLINEVLADKDLKLQIKKMMDTMVDLSKIQLRSVLKLGDEALPLIRDKADEVVDIATSTGENLGKSGIRAGLNAAQAIPGAGQVISIIRMIHAITMPAFKLFEKMTNLWIDTLKKVIKSTEKLQPGLTMGLDKAVDAFNAAKEAQILAAKKIMAMSMKVEDKINKTSNKVNAMISKLNVPQPPEIPKPQTPKLPNPQKAGRRKRRRTRKKALKKRHRRKSRRRMR